MTHPKHAAELIRWGIDLPKRVIRVDDLPPEQREEIRRRAPAAQQLVIPAVFIEFRVRR